jgi:hypothetical protein
VNPTAAAEALFCTDIQQADHAGPDQVDAAVAAQLDRLGEHGCAAAVAQEYGDHPEAARDRMAWALDTVGAYAFALA